MHALKRQRYFLHYTLSSLLRRAGRNFVLIVTFSLVVFLLASVLFFVRSLRNEARDVLASSPDILVQRMIAGRHDLIPVDYAGPIDRIRGVRKVEPRLWGYYFQAAAEMNLTLMARPDFPHPDDEVIMGHGAHELWTDALDVEDGEYWFRTFDGEPLALHVAEVLPEEADLVSADMVITSTATFRRIMGVPEGFATDLAVTVRNQNECPTIAEKILLEMPDTRPIQREEILRSYASIFDWRGGYVILVYSGAVLAFLIFAWSKATGLSAEEKTELGVLKALGWDTMDVLMVKFWEGVCISLSAFLLGTIAAYLHIYLFSGSLFIPALKGWAVLYPSFTLHPQISLTEVMSLFMLTVFPYALATVLPAWRTASADPDRVMRRV